MSPQDEGNVRQITSDIVQSTAREAVDREFEGKELKAAPRAAGWQLRHFEPCELWDRDTKIVRLAPANSDGYAGFGPRIDALRDAWGRPLAVNSCCRTADRNRRLGGHPHSLHVYDFPFHPTGGAAAIDFADCSDEFRDVAWSLGFSIGLGKTFTHLDDRFPLLAMPQTRFHYADR